MIAKENQPYLVSEIAYQFHLAEHFGMSLATSETLDLGHGRIERRQVRVMDVCSEDVDWPYVCQVLRIEREVTHKKSGKHHFEVSYGLTSQASAQADASCLLSQVRGHWSIENKSHYVRDVTFSEDASLIRTGSGPQVMAALRNAVIGLMHRAGVSNIAAACRRHAAKPWEALELLGIEPLPDF